MSKSTLTCLLVAAIIVFTVYYNRRTGLVDAIRQHEMKKLDGIIARGLKSEDKDLGLAAAVYYGDWAAFNKLLDAGADATNGNLGCANAMVEASRSGDPRWVTELIRRGANPNYHGMTSKNVMKELPTPLFHACAQGDASVIKALIDGGADVNVVSEQGITPLWWVISGNFWQAAIVLLDAGADPRMGKSNIMTAEGLFYTFRPDPDVRRMILKDPNKSAVAGWLTVRLKLIEKGFLDEDPEEVIPETAPAPAK